MGNRVTSEKKKRKLDLISSLPEDVLVTIFLKLPTHTLLHLRQVSKLFNLTISNSDFIRLHLDSPGENNGTYDLYTYPSDDTSSRLYFVFSHENELLTKDLGMPFRSVDGFLRNVGCVRGIICLHDHSNDVGTVFLWNPVVGKVKVLPSYVGLNVSTNVTVGFGYDSATHDFKVVMISYSGIRPQAFVYGLRDDHWTSIYGDVPCFMPPDIWCDSVFVDGVVHWLAYDSVEEFDAHPNCIMTFDFADEVFKVIGLPEAVEPSTVQELKLCVTADEKSVVLFVSYGDDGDLYSSFRAWIRRGDNWRMKFHAHVDDEFVPQGMLRNGQVIGSVEGHLLVVLDVEMRRCQDIDVVTPSVFRITGYTPSLALLDVGEKLVKFFEFL